MQMKRKFIMETQVLSGRAKVRGILGKNSRQELGYCKELRNFTLLTS